MDTESANLAHQQAIFILIFSKFMLFDIEKNYLLTLNITFTAIDDKATEIIRSYNP